MKGHIKFGLLFCLLKLGLCKESCEDALTIATRPYSQKNLAKIENMTTTIVQPGRYFKKDLTDVYVWANDDEIIANKTIEDVISDIIMESAFHVNGTLYVTTNYGIYKYDLHEELMNLISIVANESVVFRQIIVTGQGNVSVVGEDDTIMYLNDSPVNRPYTSQLPVAALLTGYFLAVDLRHCLVYFVRSHYSLSQNSTISNINSVMYLHNLNLPRTSYVKDQNTDNLYTVYKDTGVHYRGEDLANTVRVIITDCCVRWLGFDVKGNIFLGTDTDIIIFIPLTDMHCIEDFPKTNLSAYDLALTVLDDYTATVQNIINNKQCLTNRDEAKKFPDLDFSPAKGTSQSSHVQMIVSYSFAALLVFVGIICVSLRLNKKCYKTKDNPPSLTRENSYESIIYPSQLYNT